MTLDWLRKGSSRIAELEADRDAWKRMFEEMKAQRDEALAEAEQWAGALAERMTELDGRDRAMVALIQIKDDLSRQVELLVQEYGRSHQEIIDLHGRLREAEASLLVARGMAAPVWGIPDDESWAGLR